MKKVIRLTESDLTRIIKQVNEMMDVSSDSEYYTNRRRILEIPFDEISRMYLMAKRFCRDKDNLPDCREIDSFAYKHGLNQNQ